MSRYCFFFRSSTDPQCGWSLCRYGNLIFWLIDRSIDRLIQSLIDWLIDWLIDRSIGDVQYVIDITPCSVTISWLCFSASLETTTTLLRWTMLFMILHPDVQEKAREEVGRVTGRSRPVQLSDRVSLPYVEAVLNEVLRMANFGPFLLPHKTAVEVEFEGYVLPKGTSQSHSALSYWRFFLLFFSCFFEMNSISFHMAHCFVDNGVIFIADTTVIALNWSINRDPSLWTDWDQFMPERFLTKTGLLDNAAIGNTLSFSVGMSFLVFCGKKSEISVALHWFTLSSLFFCRKKIMSRGTTGPNGIANFFQHDIAEICDCRWGRKNAVDTSCQRTE